MTLCPQCDGELRRRRRSLLERLWSDVALTCAHCGYDHAFKTVSFFSLSARCPECHGFDLRRRRSRDRIDRMNHNPLRFLQHLFGAPLYHCESCRLQFFDLRSKQESPLANVSHLN